MDTEIVTQILKKLSKVKIAVCGDLCLDAYWILNPNGGEISVETGLRANVVSKHYYYLGGASNIIANVAALNPAYIQAIGVIGDDIYGRELISQLTKIKVDTSSIIIQKENFDTLTYAKRVLDDKEEPRMDFGFFNKRSSLVNKEIIRQLRLSLDKCDVLIFNQQVQGSLDEEFIVDANNLFNEFTHKIIIFDSRHYGNRFTNIYRKTNEREAALLNGLKVDSNDVLALAEVKQLAHNLYEQSEKPVFVTRGARGIMVDDGKQFHLIPGIQHLKKLDIVGAGDTVTSALALCLGAKLSTVEAATFANLAAGVTVEKLFQCGTASPEEILQMSNDPDYVYQPELSLDIRQAVYIDQTDIEICTENLPDFSKVKHIVFDHDGTISTLRQGWEKIMEPVMIKAILGDKYQEADETLYYRVLNRVKDYIEKSTGIETIIQMEALFEMVQEFGIVSQDAILDKFGYKSIFNKALMGIVNQRIEKFHRKELSIEDFTIKGSISFLYALKTKGVKLYLASGTDDFDARNEAEVLGYASLFDGGIYGALDNSDKYSKKMVMRRIIKENNLSGNQLVAFGDGPVELRESLKCGGFAIGVASDEIRRYGLNYEKRSRLIRAGAQIILPDYSNAIFLKKLFSLKE
jgi:rfaE bifunctional protein kinase chain/domain